MFLIQVVLFSLHSSSYRISIVLVFLFHLFCVCLFVCFFRSIISTLFVFLCLINGRAIYTLLWESHLCISCFLGLRLEIENVSKWILWFFFFSISHSSCFSSSPFILFLILFLLYHYFLSFSLCCFVAYF